MQIFSQKSKIKFAKSSVNLQFLGTTDEFCRLSPGILIDKIDISGKIVTADAMSMQKDIIKKIRKKGGDFLIGLKANQPLLRYGVEDKLKEHKPLYSYTEGPELGHGIIETRTYGIYDGLGIIADKEKWGGNMTIMEYKAETVRKKPAIHTREKRLYVSSLPTDTPSLGSIARHHGRHRKYALGTGCQSVACLKYNYINLKSATLTLTFR
ncbi:ISAs1 family transposase [Duncaniella muris]|uniref:ISAs1 family transposase n=1 Tax=Duncaniella muris TaxID=2094150 RepID=UPI002715181E|nr:ISAs1 family transposase [Duncaniella muris]